MKRVFLGWSKLPLREAARFLIEQSADDRPEWVDLSQLLVALPASRAGRRLLELLTIECEKRTRSLLPPEILTIGDLPEKLYPAKKPFASRTMQEWAWAQALRDLSPQDRDQLLRHPPAEDDHAGWLALAEIMAGLHRELAAEALDFGDVLKRGSELPGFDEAARWQVLARLQKQYLRILDDCDVWDVQTARQVAIDRQECSTERPIVLIGLTDLNMAQRLMLAQVSEQVTSLVFAPREWAGRFDAWGCLRVDQWRDISLDVPDEAVHLVDDPADQADQVIRILAAWQDRFSVEEVSIGVPDDSLAPVVLRRLGEAGVPARHGLGRPVSRTAPLMLFELIARFLEGRRADAFAALLRHPDLEDYLRRNGDADDWLSQLDDWVTRCVPAKVDADSFSRRKTLRKVFRQIDKLLAPLSRGAKKPSAWRDAVCGILEAVYGQRRLDPEVEADREVVLACDAVRAAFEEFEDDRLAPKVSGREALRLVLRSVAATNVPAPSPSAAVELLGWLDLAWDDAPALIVTSFNDGFVPASRGADAFLPNTLRHRLGIDHDERAYVRDLYAFSVLLHSRKALELIVARRSADNDPLVPSRLLFATDEHRVAQRARRLFDHVPQRPSRLKLEHGLVNSPRLALKRPRPEPLSEPVASMRVTEFRDYLACPYRYYLRHRRRLRRRDDSLVEMTAGDFGDVLHRVLQAFAGSPAAHLDEPDKIFEQLAELLDAVGRERFGSDCLTSVTLQLERARRRLEGFARWQAQWRRQGWRIKHAELQFDDESTLLEADGVRVALHGRIDRIDVNEQTGECIVFDYKTRSEATSPEKAHRNSDGEWIDLQLPLYRHLVRSRGITEAIQLGYILLPQNVDKVGEKLADWPEADLESADETARRVIVDVHAHKFWPPADPPPRGFDELAAICGDDVFKPPEADF